MGLACTVSPLVVSRVGEAAQVQVSAPLAVRVIVVPAQIVIGSDGAMDTVGSRLTVKLVDPCSWPFDFTILMVQVPLEVGVKLLVISRTASAFVCRNVFDASYHSKWFKPAKPVA